MKLSTRQIIIITPILVVMFGLGFYFLHSTAGLQYAIPLVALLIVGTTCIFLLKFIGVLVKPFFDKHCLIAHILMFFGLLALSVYLLITDTGNLIFNSISKSVGIMNSLFSFAILQFLIKEFRNNYLGKRQGNNDFEQTINNATNLGEFLKDASLWERILHDKRSRNFFDVNGKILPKTSFNDPQLTEAIISASFFNTLNRFGLYRENYTVKQQIDISKKFFNVGSSIAHDNKRNPELFEWIANLLK